MSINMIKAHSVKVGQVFIATDGSLSGHLVIDTDKFFAVNDVVVRPFNCKVFKDPQRMDSVSLSKDDFQLVAEAPDWMPAL